MTTKSPELALAVQEEQRRVFVEMISSLGARRVEKDRAEANLKLWMEEALKGAYAANTVLAWRVDCRRFERFCMRTSQEALPAEPATVRDFIDELFVTGKRLATIRRNLATISLMHSSAECKNPCEHVFVKLRMRAIARALKSRQKQARGLIWREIARFLEIKPEIPRDYRDRALVLLAYDTKCRSEEIVRMDVEHLHFDDHDGTGTVTIERSKTDQEGEGAVAFLAQDTVRALREWLACAQITSGALFRAIAGKRTVAERLRPTAVATVFCRVGLRIGLEHAEAKRLTGHATRVGSTQDQLERNLEIGVVMQSGRWKDHRMVMRYGERQLAKRSGMATLAKLQGRA